MDTIGKHHLGRAPHRLPLAVSLTKDCECTEGSCAAAQFCYKKQCKACPTTGRELVAIGDKVPMHGTFRELFAAGLKLPKDAKQVAARLCGGGSGAHVLVSKGGSGCTSKKKCNVCEGDCDRDSDCAPGLQCWQRSGRGKFALVPGCTGGGAGDVKDYDYCVQFQGGRSLRGFLNEDTDVARSLD